MFVIKIKKILCSKYKRKKSFCCCFFGRTQFAKRVICKLLLFMRAMCITCNDFFMKQSMLYAHTYDKHNLCNNTRYTFLELRNIITCKQMIHRSVTLKWIISKKIFDKRSNCEPYSKSDILTSLSHLSFGKPQSFLMTIFISLNSFIGFSKK